MYPLLLSAQSCETWHFLFVTNSAEPTKPILWHFAICWQFDLQCYVFCAIAFPFKYIMESIFSYPAWSLLGMSGLCTCPLLCTKQREWEWVCILGLCVYVCSSVCMCVWERGSEKYLCSYRVLEIAELQTWNGSCITFSTGSFVTWTMEAVSLGGQILSLVLKDDQGPLWLIGR